MLKVRNLYARKIINFPYSTKEPVMVVVREVASSPDLVRVYVKGAPELVLPSCERYYNNQFMLEDLNENEKSNILENHIVDMAQRAQKVISFAYKEMSLSDLNQMLEDFQNDLENPEFKSELVQDLIYLVTFGLDDPIRSTVAESI
jgi:magnesium-transporting ATPase (P-type)